MRSIAQQAARNGHTVAAFANIPKLNPGLSTYLKAYRRLETERQNGYTVGPIPFSKILAYGRHLGLKRDSLEYFAEVISGVDAWELREIGKKMKNDAPKPGKKARR